MLHVRRYRRRSSRSDVRENRRQHRLHHRSIDSELLAQRQERDCVCQAATKGGYAMTRLPHVSHVELVRQIIDAGVKALALKWHPDVGGSHERMAELNGCAGELRALFPAKAARKRRPPRPDLECPTCQSDRLLRRGDITLAERNTSSGRAAVAATGSKANGLPETMRTPRSPQRPPANRHILTTDNTNPKGFITVEIYSLTSAVKRAPQ